MFHKNDLKIPVLTRGSKYGPYSCSLFHTALWKQDFQVFKTVKWKYQIFWNSKLYSFNFISLHWNRNILQIYWHKSKTIETFGILSEFKLKNYFWIHLKQFFFLTFGSESELQIPVVLKSLKASFLISALLFKKM